MMQLWLTFVPCCFWVSWAMISFTTDVADLVPGFCSSFRKDGTCMYEHQHLLSNSNKAVIEKPDVKIEERKMYL